MNKIKVLIVEDETIVALDIKSALLKAGAEITNTVTNYDDAIKSVKEDMPDLVMMDINLENSKDGIHTAIDIQKIKNIPIMYLTAFTDDATIERAVQTNPIQYMLKPFKREELKTAILLCKHKIEKQKSETEENFLSIGLGYYYDEINEVLYYEDIPMKLSYKERRLLSILIQARGNIVSFEQMTYEIWSDELVSDSALRTLLYRIRTKMEHKFIETIPAFGCKINFQ